LVLTSRPVKTASILTYGEGLRVDAGRCETSSRSSMPTALDNGQRSPRKLLAALVRRLVAALRGN
jgi:hypothetical protein